MKEPERNGTERNTCWILCWHTGWHVKEPERNKKEGCTKTQRAWRNLNGTYQSSYENRQSETERKKRERSAKKQNQYCWHIGFFGFGTKPYNIIRITAQLVATVLAADCCPEDNLLISLSFHDRVIYLAITPFVDYSRTMILCVSVLHFSSILAFSVCWRNSAQLISRFESLASAPV